jgi:hypothetical protein
VNNNAHDANSGIQYCTQALKNSIPKGPPKKKKTLTNTTKKAATTAAATDLRREQGSTAASKRRGRGEGEATLQTRKHTRSEEQWWEPPQTARARPEIHGVTRRKGSGNRLKIHWLTRS